MDMLLQLFNPFGVDVGIFRDDLVDLAVDALSPWAIRKWEAMILSKQYE